jgi:hypothetical protein
MDLILAMTNTFGNAGAMDKYIYTLFNYLGG